MNCVSKLVIWVGCFVVLALFAPNAVAAKLTFQINDANGAAVPCRIHLLDPAGKSLEAPGLPFWKDHFVCPGRVDLSPAAGTYSYVIERGPEHEQVAGKIELAEGRDETVTVTLRRIADLKSLGWHGGETHVHRPPQDVPLLMQAEDLHVAQVITWWNKRNPWTSSLPDEALRQPDRDRFFHVLAGEDERGGGALLYFHLPRPLEITKAEREFPSSLSFLKQARQAHPSVWIDVEKPFWWDVPLWLASGEVDSIGIANNHMCRSQMYRDEAWGKPRDTSRLPNPHGNGLWTQEIYYHLLNSGLRVPPSAGSASGVLPNPVGYNRVYVHTGPRLDYEEWWKNLKAGRSFVTNGPLLLVRADDKLPGEVFQFHAPKTIKLEIQLISRDRVPRIEILQNGEVVQTLDCSNNREQQLTAELSVSKSGWFLVRAIADNPQTFRFASTAPFYVEIGNVKTNISRKSCEFFQKWAEERTASLREKLSQEDERREVLPHHERAVEFWTARARQANAD
ncbi:MAG: CehA/McbA family metallohydrolase [Planctomycetota bacterium]